MNMSTISLETPVASGPAGPATVSPGAPVPGDTGFAERLALAFSRQPAGQDLAAGIPTLQTLTLGPTLEVVTAPADKPDGASLAEFAKAQGLDDDVVAWLFSDPGLVTGAVPLAAPGAIAVTSPSAAASVTEGPLSQAVSGFPVVPDAAANALALALAPISPNWILQMDMVSRPAATGLATTDAAAEPIVAMPGFNPATGFMATALNTRPGAADSSRQAAATPPGIPVEVLSLTVEPELQALWDTPASADLPLEALSSADDRPLPAAGASANAGQNLADDAPVASTSGARAEGYEALTQRVGEALAQRVLSQIERGQWQVRLLLKPAKLGEVEIDLKMHGGELDASFRAANPVTRDLLNDGLSRLREVLANAGMEIADLSVASGKSQQPGGNPTPRQSAAPAAGEGPAGSEMTAASTQATQAARRTPGSDWDVLV